VIAMAQKKAWIVIGIFLLTLLANAEAQEVKGRNIVVTIENQPEQLVYQNARLQNGPSPTYTGTGNFNGTLLDFAGKKLFEFSFSSDSTTIAEGLGRIPATTAKMLVLPYFKNVAKLEIAEKSGNKKLSVNLGFLAQLCGNNVCDPNESFGDCPQDCKSGQKDNYCDKQKDGICDPDCGNNSSLDADCVSAPQAMQSFFLVGQKLPLVTAQMLNQSTNQSPVGGISILQIVGILSIIAVIAGLVLFGRSIQKERLPPNPPNELP